MNAGLGRLREAGLSPNRTRHAYHALDSHIVGFVLSVGSWYFFHEGLGVILPAGILDGVL